MPAHISGPLASALAAADARRRAKAAEWLARIASTPALQVDTAEAGCNAVEFAHVLLIMLTEARAGERQARAELDLLKAAACPRCAREGAA